MDLMTLVKSMLLHRMVSAVEDHAQKSIKEQLHCISTILMQLQPNSQMATTGMKARPRTMQMRL